MVMIMFCGFSVGAALGGLLAATLIPHFGGARFSSSAHSPAACWLRSLALRLPESVRFLALTGHANQRVAELLGLINPKAAFAPARNSSCMNRICRNSRVLHLFREGRTLVTLLLWVVFS